MLHNVRGLDYSCVHHDVVERALCPSKCRSLRTGLPPHLAVSIGHLTMLIGRLSCAWTSVVRIYSISLGLGPALPDVLQRSL